MDRVFVVTGAAAGIGLAIAEHLLAEGAKVALLDSDQLALRRLHGLRDRYGGAALVSHCDVSNELSVKSNVAKVLQTFARINGLVNNAGIADPESGSVTSLELTDWQRWLNVDLTGPFLMAKHCLNHIAETNGAVVNIASSRALQSEPNTEAYAAAKGGLVSLTHALAISFADSVRVNCISPGWIVTDEFASDNSTTDLTSEDHRQHPAGRVGRPQDIAEMAAFLLSEKSGFITGQNYVIDGGIGKKMIYN